MQLYLSGVGTHVPLPVHIETPSVVGENPALQRIEIVAPSRVLLIAPKIPLLGGSGDPQSTTGANETNIRIYKQLALLVGVIITRSNDRMIVNVPLFTGGRKFDHKIYN